MVSQNVQKKAMFHAVSRVLKNPRTILGLGIIGYCIYFLYFVFTKYGYFGYNGVDLAIFNQVMWNIVHGNGAWSSIQGHHYFGDHFSPILYLLAPLYALWQDPRMLLITQVVVMGLTAIPVWLIARYALRESKDLRLQSKDTDKKELATCNLQLATHADWYALLFAFAWLLNPLIHNATVYEFHTYSFAVLFLLCAVYYYFRSGEGGDDLRRYKTLFIVCIGLALMTREDIALVVAMMGVMVIVLRRRHPELDSGFRNKNK